MALTCAIFGFQDCVRSNRDSCCGDQGAGGRSPSHERVDERQREEAPLALRAAQAQTVGYDGGSDEKQGAIESPLSREGNARWSHKRPFVGLSLGTVLEFGDGFGVILRGTVAES